MVFYQGEIGNEPVVSMRGTNIGRVRNTKFLGVNIDDKLKFKEHVEALAKKLSMGMGIIFRLSPFIPYHLLFTLYYSLMYPHIIYCSSVWSGCSEGNYNRLNRIHKREERLLVNRDRNRHTKCIMPLKKLFTFMNGVKLFNIRALTTSYISEKDSQGYCLSTIIRRGLLMEPC